MKKAFLFVFLLFGFFASAQSINFEILNDEKEIVEINAEWNEKWFGEESSYEYNHNLARIAAVLSECSYTNVEENRQENMLALSYSKLGVKKSDIEYHYEIDYDEPIWGNNQAAFSFAHKKINSSEGERDLVFITVRGTPTVANEWISNIDISDSTQKAEEIHEGFFYTTEKIHKALIYFLLKKNVNPDNAFFFITGHSRGAAVSNLLGATLADENYFDLEHIFVYTFAAPNVSMELRTQDSRYNFIWNIVNAEDIVPTVPPNRDNWKYRKFGNTLTIANAWNVSVQKYEDELLPKMNILFQKFYKRNYAPFKTGPFIPVQISRLLTGFYGEVAEYYANMKGLRQKAENMFWKVFPKTFAFDEKSEEKKESGNNRLMKKMAEKLNESFNGVFDYASDAFADMHAMETYLSWMISLDSENLFSDVGSSQIVIEKSYDAAVFDSNGTVVARVIDGLLQLKSLKMPIAAMPYPRKTVIGFPSNADFKVIVYKNSLIPTIVPTKIEHYTASGIFKNEDVKKNIFPQKWNAYLFDAGKITMNQTEIEPVKIHGKEVRFLKDIAELKSKQIFRIQPEMSLDTDCTFEFGASAGCQNIYGSLLMSFPMTSSGKAIALSLGAGHQNCLFDRIFFDYELFSKFFWALDKDYIGKDDSIFNLVPSFRIAISYKPFRRFQLFVASDFDFNIEDFNDGAFDSDLREKNIGKWNIFDSVNIVPSIKFGVKF